MTYMYGSKKAIYVTKRQTPVALYFHQLTTCSVFFPLILSTGIRERTFTDIEIKLSSHPDLFLDMSDSPPVRRLSSASSNSKREENLINAYEKAEEEKDHKCLVRPGARTGTSY